MQSRFILKALSCPALSTKEDLVAFVNKVVPEENGLRATFEDLRTVLNADECDLNALAILLLCSLGATLIRMFSST